jgi:hypothetical protein
MGNGKNGELITREEAGRYAESIALARHYGLSTGLAERLSRFRFVTRIQIDRTNAATELAAAELRFMNVYHEHQLAQDRLFSVYREAEHRERMRQAENENQLLEAQLRRKQLERQLKDFDGPADDDIGAHEARARRSARVEAAKKSAWAKEKLEIRQELFRERDQTKAEILEGSGGAITPEVERQLQDIDDVYQGLIDNL